MRVWYSIQLRSRNLFCSAQLTKFLLHHDKRWKKDRHVSKMTSKHPPVSCRNIWFVNSYWQYVFMKKYEKSTEEIFCEILFMIKWKIGAKSGYGAFYSIIMHSESLQRVYIEMSTLNHIYKQLSNYIDCSFRYWWENDCKGCNILWRVTWFMRLQSK